ncbi:P-loop containing nucleoside triphosphate hydrolase protein, partial [Catenaria anguillulae PL171]
RPLLIGISGPQGSGKTTLTRNLVTLLSSTPRPGRSTNDTSTMLRVLAISLDDFYKTHAELVALESLHPTNKLLHGRGLPGTHDVALLLSTLNKLSSRNPADYPIHVPVYDKAAFNGKGDRSSTEKQVVTAPLDVILLEGWMLGFAPPTDPESDLTTLVSPDLLAKYGLGNLTYVATHELSAYAAIDTMLDHFIHWTPANVGIVYTWRVQQEQELRARNGGIGMTDDQVGQFVDRYMPMYQACVPKL